MYFRKTEWCLKMWRMWRRICPLVRSSTYGSMASEREKERNREIRVGSTAGCLSLHSVVLAKAARQGHDGSLLR